MAFMLPILGAAGGAMGTVGTVLSTASVLIGGMAAYGQAQAASSLAKQNAAIERDNAARARLEAASAEEAQRRDARKHLGSMAAAMAQNGGGDGQLLMRQSATEAELDAMNIRYRGERQAYGHEVNAASLDAEAKNQSRNATFELIGAGLGAGGRLLSGIGDYGITQAQTQAMRRGAPAPRKTRSGVVVMPSAQRVKGGR